MTQDPSNPYQAPATTVLESHLFASHPRAVPITHAFSWIRGGWNLFMRAPGAMILMMLVYFVIYLITGMVPLLQFASPLLSTLLTGGIFIGLQRLERTGTLKVEDLFATFNIHLIPLILLGLLMAAFSLVLVAALILLGLGSFLGNSGNEPNLGMFLMLIPVAAILFSCLYYVVFLATLLVVLADRPVPAALSSALAAFLKNLLPFFLYGLLAFLISLIALIPLGLGMLVTVPVVIAAMYVSFHDIFAAE